MSSTSIVRDPDTTSTALMTKRAWWLVGLNVLVPGSAQTLAGNRRFGRFALGTTLAFWALVVIGVLAALIGREAVLPVVTQPVVLWAMAAVLGLYGLLWVICAIDALRLSRLARVSGRARVAVAVVSIAALVVTGGAAFGAAWTAGTTANILAKVASNTIDITGPDGKPVAVGALTGPANILLVGDDSGDGNAAYGPRGESLNDVTILIHLSPVSHSVTAVSIPRDLYVAQPQCTKANGTVSPAVKQARFNTALSRGGLNCVVASASALTGLPIQYAAKIEFDGVVAMSDAVGGVPVCLATAINDPYSGLTLSAGEHTLQGAQALAFLRTRHGLSTGSDLQRISNQQVFLSSLMRTIKSSETLGNPVKVIALAEAAAQNMQLSTELAQTSTMVSMALALRSIPLDRIAFVQYPSSPATVHGQSVTLPNDGDASALTAALAADQAVVTQKLGGAAVSSGAPSGSSATPTPSASATPSGGVPVQLPSGISGQAADQSTCSKGQTG
ncbi:LCP family protein [Lysinimonas soli]|uniref:LCP family protein n=1 Tax=Lysinimonas soli TaxID=1074233 RepID=A0ABW0NTZ8_9MICO